MKTLSLKTLPSRKPRTVAVATSGMRRVDCVRMVEGESRPRFFVVGVGHRFPVEREVDASVALALLEQVPCRYEFPRPGAPVDAVRDAI